jgi:hypothetical protein
MGIDADVSFPTGGGSHGPADVDISFKPPEGVSISIDAGPVTGAGYLEYDPENERYAGAVQVKTEKVTINAVGLLTTELPGGKDGFSLLLILTGDFPPVELGLGFTLNAVGGVIGINRDVKQKPLGNAVREGSIDSVLFPENPVANAARIVSDLRAIFPPRDDNYLVGPMARLGWGKAGLIDMDLGIIVSLPNWKVVLLGKLSSVLPDEKAAVVELNMAVTGFLDIPNLRVAIDASLYDSRVLHWTLSGDMALRSRLGSDPRFVMSVGGWNPRFEPPSDFPDLRRAKACIGDSSGDPRLEFAGYFALTANTVQTGAKFFAKAEAGPATVKGHLQIDTLVEFNPFRFVVDFSAEFSVTVKGKGLSITIDGTLMGPGPFRVNGTVKIDIFLFSLTANLNVSIGPSKGSEELPRARILPKLTAELGDSANWTAKLPADGPELVTLREVEAGGDAVTAHPLGDIGVRQTVVPLDYEIEKFGKATPSGYTTFSISAVRVNGPGTVSLAAETVEQFAPAQYRKMSDSEKLNSPAFEGHPAGRKMDHGGVYCGYPEADQAKQEKNVRSAAFTYECTVIDRPRDNWARELSDLGRFASEGLAATSALPARVGDSLSQISASAQSSVRHGGSERFRLSEADKQMFDAQAAGFASEIDVSGTVNGKEEDSDEGETGKGQVVRGGGNPDVGGLSGAVSMEESSYTVVDAGAMREIEEVDDRMSKTEAQRRIRQIREANPERAKQLRVVESRKVQSAGQKQRATDGGRPI